MTRSRFEKLEGERPAAEDTVDPDKRLDARFAAEPELGTRADASDAGAAHLGRFDADGGDGLGLDRDPLAKLPMLQCPACQVDCGKFETACSRCGASLTDAAARAHNLTRAEALSVERATAQEAVRAKRAEEIAELEVSRMRTREAQEGFAGELRETFANDGTVRGPHWPWVVAAVVCFGLARLVPWFGLRMFFVAAGTVCLLTRLPKSAWEALAKPARRRGGW